MGDETLLITLTTGILVCVSQNKKRRKYTIYILVLVSGVGYEYKLSTANQRTSLYLKEIDVGDCS